MKPRRVSQFKQFPAMEKAVLSWGLTQTDHRTFRNYCLNSRVYKRTLSDGYISLRIESDRLLDGTAVLNVSVHKFVIEKGQPGRNTRLAQDHYVEDWAIIKTRGFDHDMIDVILGSVDELCATSGRQL